MIMTKKATANEKINTLVIVIQHSALYFYMNQGGESVLAKAST